MAGGRITEPEELALDRFGIRGVAFAAPSRMASGTFRRGTLCMTVLTVGSWGIRWYMLTARAVPSKSPEIPPSAYPGKKNRVSSGVPITMFPMFTPGFPRPCMAMRQTMERAHSMPVAQRQAPPTPFPAPPAAR